MSPSPRRGPLARAALLALLALLLAALLPVLAQAAGLPSPVRRALQAQGIPAESVAVWVQAVDGSRPRLAANAERPMSAASVMKLVTTFAAFDRLGTAYTWTTRVKADAPIEGGVLRGDLYLVGGGDPVLGYERLWKLLRQLRALGISRVAGDIVLDGSFLRLPPFDPDAFDGRGLRPYNAGPDGLLVNFSALRLTLIPAATPGEPVALAADPPLAGLAIDNKVVTGAASECTGWDDDLAAALDSAAVPPRLVVSGSLPAACGRRDWNVAPLPAGRYQADLVAALWAEIGGRVDGRVRPGLAPPAARELIADESPPLAEVAHDMNKWSNNLIARQLLATLGATVASPSADMVADGAAAATAALGAAGISTAGLVVDNGAGLSRTARVTAQTLGELLVAAWRQPWMPDFVAGLPRAGVDGTARKRLAASPARGYAYLKTGTLDGVRAMAGYVLDRGGRRHAVVMLVNDPRARASSEAQDALIEWVWAGAEARAVE